jgi:hypothetical protein
MPFLIQKLCKQSVRMRLAPVTRPEGPLLSRPRRRPSSSVVDRDSFAGGRWKRMNGESKRREFRSYHPASRLAFRLALLAIMELTKR